MINPQSDTARYIKIYDDIFTNEFCSNLIESSKNSPHWFRRETSKYSFDELPLMETEFSNELNLLKERFTSLFELYQKDCAAQGRFNPKWQFESFRMKKYNPYVDGFDFHSDANTYNRAQRFLVMFLYLNEGENGGTLFSEQKLIVKRKPGRVIVFPPYYMYPHAGQMPRGNPKYILGTYFCHKK